MKKSNNSNTNTNAKGGKGKGKGKGKSKGEAPARVTLKYRETVDILSSAEETDTRVTFDLVEKQKEMHVCTLTIYPSDEDYDNGVLELFGLSIRVTIRSGQNGMYLSFPARKSSKGDWFDLVKCFDANFHACIKEVLAAYYEDETEGDE